MIKCKDSDGNEVSGVLRNPTSNALVFERSDKYIKYMKDKQQAEKIAHLETEIGEIKAMLSQLLTINNEKR